MSEFTFIHIPRNGGTTIKRIINNLGISRTVAHDRHIWAKNMYAPPVHTGNNIDVNHPDKRMKTEVAVPYSPANLLKMVTHKTRCADAVGKSIVVIRDPLDRLLSIYKFWKYGGEKNRKRKEKRGKTEDEKREEETRMKKKTPEAFIDMMESKEVSYENSNNGTFCHEYLLPQSHWVNIDNSNSNSGSMSDLIIIPYCKNEKEAIDHVDYVDNTDIVSSFYNIIKGSKTLKKRDHENFKEAHVQLTEMRLNECSKESSEVKEEDTFTESELMYFRIYYRSDYEMISRLNIPV